MDPSSMKYVTVENFKKNKSKKKGKSRTDGVVSVIAAKADPTVKIKFAIMAVITIIFIILAIILIPAGISATISGKYASGLSSFVIGGLLAGASFWMLSNMF